MHPFALTRTRLALYLGAWLVLGLGAGALLTMAASVAPVLAFSFAVPVALLEGVIWMSAFWVCRSLPLGETPVLRMLTGLLVAALQATVVWVAFGAIYLSGASSLAHVTLSRAEVMPVLATLAILGVPLYAMSIVVHYLMLAFERSREAEHRSLESRVSAREAELRALRAQLNPHFLFNSLNSVNALIGSDPEAARRMCEGLGDFLRRTLALGSRDRVTLAEELALVDRYLMIEHVRFGDRLTVERAVEEGAERCLVPPLLLQPLVENAIKHGVAERVQGGTLHLSAVRRNGLLTLTVENDVDPDSPQRKGEGVGLENVRRRLDALAAREGRLEARREPDQFRVTLTLPAVEAATEGTHAGV